MIGPWFHEFMATLAVLPPCRQDILRHRYLLASRGRLRVGAVDKSFRSGWLEGISQYRPLLHVRTGQTLLERYHTSLHESCRGRVRGGLHGPFSRSTAWHVKWTYISLGSGIFWASMVQESLEAE